MRIANLLFASAAFADKNIDQLTKKVRIASFSIKTMFFRKCEIKMARLVSFDKSNKTFNVIRYVSM